MANKLGRVEKQAPSAQPCQPDWNACFSNKVTDPTEIHRAYKQVLEIFAQDIGAHIAFVVPASGGVPLNVR